MSREYLERLVREGQDRELKFPLVDLIEQAINGAKTDYYATIDPDSTDILVSNDETGDEFVVKVEVQS